MSFLSWLVDSKNYEEEAKEFYLMGFRDGRLCPSVRQCEVDGKACVFHRWIEEDEAMLKFNIMVGPEELEGMLRCFEQDKVVAPGCSLNIVRHAYALVEYPDGSMGKVTPESVCFLDRKKEK